MKVDEFLTRVILSISDSFSTGINGLGSKSEKK